MSLPLCYIYLYILNLRVIIIFINVFQHQLTQVNGSPRHKPNDNIHVTDGNIEITPLPGMEGTSLIYL